MDPLHPIDRVDVLSDLIGESISCQRLYAVVVSTFAGIALLITALGIYGLSAYSVSRRSREIAVRLSLGATARHIRSTTLGRATVLAGEGVLIGLVVAWMGARVLDAFVFGLATRDPRVFLGVALLLTLAAIVAAYAPARRASRIDPMLVLRSD